MPKSLAVLNVEDSESDALLIARLLRHSEYNIVFEQVETAAQMRAALERQPWDIVISDYSLPQFSCYDALKLLQSTGLDIPFIAVSGVIGEETAVHMMKAGAHDYLMKNNLARLLPAIEREISQAEHRRKRQQAELALQESERFAQATVDALPLHLAILDQTGTIIAVNNAWRVYAHASAPNTAALCEGANYLMVCDKAKGLYATEAVSMAAGIRAVIRGEHAEFSLEYPCHSPEAEAWFHARVTRFMQADSIRIMVAHDNITSRKQAEIRITTNANRLNALRKIDATIASSRDLQLTFTFLLEQTASQLGMRAASVLVLDTDSTILRYAASYGFTNAHLPDTSQLADCLAGKLLPTQSIAQILNNPLEIHSNQCFSDLWNAEGFQYYCATPLTINGELKGLLEVFGHRFHHADPEWLTYLETLSEQFALAIDRAQLSASLQVSNHELAHAYNSTIEGWSRALDMRDKETDGHSQRVTEMTERLAQALGTHGAELRYVRWGALLHDMGKMGVPDAILLKPGALTEEEWVLMKRHPQLAYDMLAPITYLQQSLDIPYCHHEKWDGTGYPRGLKGEEIPLAARLFAVVDVWDALKSDRPYRAGWPTEKVLAHIRSLSGTHFDPLAVELFLHVIDEIGYT